MPREGNDGDNTKEGQWKNKDEIYLFELQKFFDIVENVENKELRKAIIAQMLKCDKRLTQIAEKNLQRLEKEYNHKCIKNEEL